MHKDMEVAVAQALRAASALLELANEAINLGALSEVAMTTAAGAVKETAAAVAHAMEQDVGKLSDDKVTDFRSRNIGSQFGAGLKSILGGELKGMTKSLALSRNEVITRMTEEAEAKGANAVVAMRFDTSEMGQSWTEICAYGTAVQAVPVSDGARRTAGELGYGSTGSR